MKSISHHDSCMNLAYDRTGIGVKKLYAEAGQHGSTIIVPGSANGNGYTNGHSEPGSRSAITAQRRGELAVEVASVKVVTTDTGLDVTAGLFELLGARATGRKYGFDRFWRDVRTHTLHDPVAYKKREVGRWHVLGEIPEPTWYT